MKHIPLRDGLLVKVVSVSENRTASGIFMPGGGSPDFNVGQIERVGQGYYNQHGNMIQPESSPDVPFEVGQFIGFKLHGLLPMVREAGVTYYIVPSAEVLTLVEDFTPEEND